MQIPGGTLGPERRFQVHDPSCFPQCTMYKYLAWVPCLALWTASLFSLFPISLALIASCFETSSSLPLVQYKGTNGRLKILYDSASTLCRVVPLVACWNSVCSNQGRWAATGQPTCSEPHGEKHSHAERTIQREYRQCKS